MIVLTPELYTVTVCLVALWGTGVATVFMRYKKSGQITDLVRLIASPFALAGFATAFVTHWGSRFVAVYAIVVVIGDVVLSRRQTQRGLTK